MYSLNLKNSFAQLKKSLKKGLTKGKDAIKRLSQEFDLAIDPNKTSLKFPRTYYPEMSKDKILREDDPNFRRWKNWVIKKFAYLGFGSQYNIISVNDKNRGILAFNFDFKKRLLYDPLEVRLIKGDGFGDDWWRSGGQRYSRYEVIWVDGSIGFNLDYAKESFKTLLFIDYKKPMISVLDSTFINGLKALSDQIANDFSLLLYSEFSKVEVDHIKNRIDKRVSNPKIKKELTEITDLFSSAEEDIDIDQKEINKIIKEIKDIPDIEFQDELLEILEKMQKLDIEEKRKILKKVKRIIIEYRD